MPKPNTPSQTSAISRPTKPRKRAASKTRAPVRPEPHIVRIGARGSPLAVAQAVDFAHQLEAASGGLIRCTQHAFTTRGDQILDQRLQDAGGKGLFTRELDLAQLNGEIDVAVHSLKDVPTVLPEGLVMGCYLPRKDPRDALIGPYASIAALPSGARLGTASLRRGAQALALRPDLEIVMFRGNVQTRLRKLEEGLADATLLAAAGLNRLGMLDKAAALIPVETMLPAGGQGIVCATLAEGAPDWLTAACAAIDIRASRLAAIAERAFLKRLDGSCRTPIAAHFILTPDGAEMGGEVLSDDGRHRWRADGAIKRPPSEADAEELGLMVAEDVAAYRARDLNT